MREEKENSLGKEETFLSDQIHGDSNKGLCFICFLLSEKW